MAPVLIVIQTTMETMSRETADGLREKNNKTIGGAAHERHFIGGRAIVAFYIFCRKAKVQKESIH